MDMILPMKMMMENMNKGQHIPALDFVQQSTHQIGMIYSLFSEDYDGGDFCRGLIFSHEAGQLMLSVGRTAFSGMFNHDSKDSASDNPMLHDLLQG